MELPQRCIEQWLQEVDTTHDQTGSCNARSPDSAGLYDGGYHAAEHTNRTDIVVMQQQKSYGPSRKQTREALQEDVTSRNEVGARCLTDIASFGEELGMPRAKITVQNNYERRPRRKTKPDRYEPKRGPIGESSDLAVKDTKKRKLVQRKNNRNTRVSEGFRAANVRQGRLTLDSSNKLGIFKKGKTSSPIQPCEISYLNFSERAFLSKQSKYFEDKRSECIPKSHKLTSQPEREDIAHRFGSFKLQHTSQDDRPCREPCFSTSAHRHPDRLLTAPLPARCANSHGVTQTEFPVRLRRNGRRDSDRGQPLERCRSPTGTTDDAQSSLDHALELYVRDVLRDCRLLESHEEDNMHVPLDAFCSLDDLKGISNSRERLRMSKASKDYIHGRPSAVPYMQFPDAVASSCANADIVTFTATGSADKIAHRKSNRDLQAQRTGADSQLYATDNSDMLLAVDPKKALDLGWDNSGISHQVGFVQNFSTPNEVLTSEFIRPRTLTQIMELDSVEDGIDMSSYVFGDSDIGFSDITEYRRKSTEDCRDHTLLDLHADDPSQRIDSFYELPHDSHICPSPQPSEFLVRQRGSELPGVRNIWEDEVLTSLYLQSVPDCQYNNNPDGTHALFWDSPSELSNQLSRTIARPVPSRDQPEGPARAQSTHRSPELHRFWRQNKLH